MYKLEDFDFEKLSKKEPNPKTRIRLLGLQHLKEGKTQLAVAAMFKKTSRAVSDWLRRFKHEGINGLIDKHRSGKKPKLPKIQEEEFKKAIEHLRQSKDGGQVLGKDIQKLLKEKFCVNYQIKGVYKLLKRLDLVYITGRSIHPKANLEAQKSFKKNILRNRKKSYS